MLEQLKLKVIQFAELCKWLNWDQGYCQLFFLSANRLIDLIFSLTYILKSFQYY